MIGARKKRKTRPQTVAEWAGCHLTLPVDGPIKLMKTQRPRGDFKKFLDFLIADIYRGFPELAAIKKKKKRRARR